VTTWTIDWDAVPSELQRDRLVRQEAELHARLDPVSGLVRQPAPGHSSETRHLEAVHCGRTTAEWIALRCLLHGPTPEERPALAALAQLQVTTPGDPFFGCSRWYGEETRPHDTNAAFFIGRLLAVRWLLAPGSTELPPYFQHAAAWFAHECREPILYYPNKIISDGCLGLALAHLRGDAALQATAEAFLDRWCSYTERRGWGWGENLSTGYTGVILDAFWLALPFLPPGALRCRLLALQDELVENLAFHSPEQPVPAIRSYNFIGDTRCRGGIFRVLDLPGAEAGIAPSWLSALLLHMAGPDVQARIADHRPPHTEPIRRRVQRIFGDTAATSYVEGAFRLGTISRFPVMPGCNQHSGWGLGWQSMPTAFLVEQQNYGFLQWSTCIADDIVCTHPASGFHTGYGAPALFAEPILPETITTSRQQDGIAISVRSLFRLANVAAAIADQWRVPAFRGTCSVDRVSVGKGERVAVPGWAVLLYPGGAVAVRALQVLAYGATTIAAPALHVAWEDDTLLLRQTLREGPPEPLAQERIECGWVTVLLPGVDSAEEATARLAEVTVAERWHLDGELPRQPWHGIRSVRVTAPGIDLALDLDPWLLPRT